MPRFEILAGSVVIGYSELESGDPPMGVATGKLVPSPEYVAFQPSIVAAREASQEHLGLRARLSGGPELPAQGGVHIFDASAELGAEGIEVNVLGVGYPLYEELFPEHVAAYRAMFSE